MTRKCPNLKCSPPSFKGESDECPGGCTYNRDDQPDTVYCFGPGVRTAVLECDITGMYQGDSHHILVSQNIGRNFRHNADEY